MAVIWRGRSPSAASGSRELDPDGTLVAFERVGPITYKDCKPGTLGRNAECTGHFSRLRGSNTLEDCDLLQARGDADTAPRRCGSQGRGRITTPAGRRSMRPARGEDGAGLS
jgi:hypothetical protein